VKNNRIVGIWLLILVLIGISYLLNPIMDGWSEVYLARWFNNRWIWIVLGAVTKVILILHLFFLLYKSVRTKSLIYKPIVLCLSIIIIFANIPSFFGATRADMRILGFQLGAMSKISAAGGQERIIEDSFQFLHEDINISDVGEWPNFLNRLGAIEITIGEEKDFINVRIPLRDFTSDQFGYLIYDKNIDTLDIDMILGTSNFRLWAIREKIYLYEKW
jgi:hypothetical protein